MTKISKIQKKSIKTNEFNLMSLCIQNIFRPGIKSTWTFLYKFIRYSREKEWDLAALDAKKYFISTIFI